MRFGGGEPGNLGAEARSPERDWTTDPATLTRVSEALTRQLSAGMPVLEPAGAPGPGRPLPRRRPGRYKPPAGYT